MNNPKALKKYLVILLFIFLSLVGAHTGGFRYDLECFKNWSLHIFTNGLPHAYTEWNNYMPFYQYVMWVYGKIAGSEEEIGHLIMHIKVVAIAFDFLGLWYVYKWIDKKVDFLLVLLFNMLNIAYAYNSVVWGQVDAIYTAMVFISLYYAFQGRMALSAIWYVLAINMKLQAIVFLPVLGLVYLYIAADKRSLKQVAYTLCTVVVLQLLLLWPFLTITNGFNIFWKEVMSATTIYPTVTCGSFNIWFFFFKGNEPRDFPDSTVFLAGISYMKAGLILFCTASFFALWPLLKSLYLKLVKKDANTMISKEKFWIICALIAISFFYFNTQMHERYSHPAFIFLAAYAFSANKVFPYILFSVAYFLNLEEGMKWLWFTTYDFWLFNPRLSASIYGVLILYLYIKLYSGEPQRPKEHPALPVSA